MDSKSVVSIAKCDGYEDIEHVNVINLLYT